MVVVVGRVVSQSVRLSLVAGLTGRSECVVQLSLDWRSSCHSKQVVGRVNTVLSDRRCVPGVVVVVWSRAAGDGRKAQAVGSRSW
jgi:hypothetical protein